jgi:hypothetical protein
MAMSIISTVASLNNANGTRSNSALGELHGSQRCRMSAAGVLRVLPGGAHPCIVALSRSGGSLHPVSGGGVSFEGGVADVEDSHASGGVGLDIRE